MTRKRKKALIFFGSIVVFLTLIWMLRNYLSPINSIERATGLEFPSGISQVDQYDNLEFNMVAHLKLPDAKVQSFAEEYNFSSHNPSSRIVPNSQAFRLASVIVGAQSLDVENQTVPDDADLLFLYGNDESNCWRYVLDQNNGRLWVSLIYPDRSGDLGCE